MAGAAYPVGLAPRPQNVSRFLITYPISWIADTLVRRVAIRFGHALCTVGAPVNEKSVLWMSFPLVIIGMLVIPERQEARSSASVSHA